MSRAQLHDSTMQSANGSVRHTAYPVPTGGLIAHGDAWAIGWCAPVLFTLFHAQPQPADFERFLAATINEIDDCPEDVTRAIVHHAAAHGQIDAAQRRAVSEALLPRRDKMAKICTGYVFCTHSSLARGVIKVINWLSPPPYPFFDAANVLNGLNLLQRVDRRINPTQLIKQYEVLFAERLMQSDPDFR